ncbi:hypothetical protein [Brachybacterium sacelli]|uniref:Uncharacterized protein n=1 Tax=Brachybacterium sacelli TaxID=173364 RepID=A0ABS4X5J6_9MICO|nr:hypothetical protein [Brachybacterium sacelli]MBP2383734.1 hypothetical protein [Brachybacterium sacelli]
MASLIESVRKLHGPTLITHENGYDVDVICQECTRLRLDALEGSTSGGEDWGYSEETARVAYPCNTRIVAGTSAAEGKEEASRMRLDRLVVQREELEEQMERLDAVIGLIRRDLGDKDAQENAEGPSAEPASPEKSTTKASPEADTEADTADPSSDGESDPAADFDF